MSTFPEDSAHGGKQSMAASSSFKGSDIEKESSKEFQVGERKGGLGTGEEEVRYRRWRCARVCGLVWG